MTRRNRWHSRITARIAQLLNNWLEKQPLPRGEILCGEAGCILSRDPDSSVGIDVVYISAEVSQLSSESTLIDGVPVLVVEVLSPNDKQIEIDEKVDVYQKAGVPLIWVVDPHDKTVLVYRLGEEPTLVNMNQELSGEPFLPGFAVPAKRVFS